MGDLASDVLFRMPARDVIHYSRSPALTNLMHGQVPATIPKLLCLTLLSICIHIAPDKAAYCVFTQFRGPENAIKLISVRTKTQ